MFRYAVSMTDEMDPLELIDASTARYRETEKAHEEARQAVVNAVLNALRAGKRPTDVAGRSPFTDSYIRRVARENGIKAQPRRRKKRSGID